MKSIEDLTRDQVVEICDIIFVKAHLKFLRQWERSSKLSDLGVEIDDMAFSVIDLAEAMIFEIANIPNTIENREYFTDLIIDEETPLMKLEEFLIDWIVNIYYDNKPEQLTIDNINNNSAE